MKEFVLDVPLRRGDMDAAPQGGPHDAPCAMASGESGLVMKEFNLEVPLRWGDMDATPQAFHMMRRKPWRPVSRGWS